MKCMATVPPCEEDKQLLYIQHHYNGRFAMAPHFPFLSYIKKLICEVQPHTVNTP